MQNIDIAEICHEANRVYCLLHGDATQLPWNEAPDWQKKSAIAGVDFHLKNPNSKPEDSHNSWLIEKENDGWTHGPVKDAEKKEHPCMVTFESLPKEQQAKDHLFVGIVRALEPFLD